VLVDNPFPL